MHELYYTRLFINQVQLHRCVVEVDENGVRKYHLPNQ